MMLSFKLGRWVLGAAALMLAVAGCGSGGGGGVVDAAPDQGKDLAKDQAKDQSSGSGGAGTGGAGGSGGTSDVASDHGIDTPGETGTDLAPDAPSEKSPDVPAELPPDAATDRPADGAVDASAETDGATDDDAATGETAAEVSSDTSADAGTDTGVPGPTALRLVAGRARLVGTPTTACSKAAPGAAATDQWCAFTLPGQVLGTTELWVINASQALTATVTCTGNDPACLRLTTNLWTGQPDAGPTHPFSHHFYGQTLIFYAAPVVGTNAYDGPIFGWRPGLTQARQISGAHAFSCDGQPGADAALCLEDVNLVVRPPHFDIHAGRVASAPLPLPLAGTIYPSTTTNASQWSVAFSPTGDYVAHSTGGATVTEPETLYATKTDEVGMAGKVVTVATSVSQWDITPDSKHWFFMRDFNYPPRNSVVDPSGTLTMAAFPAGGSEKTIATQVGLYVLLGDATTDRGVAFLDHLLSGKGTYKLIANPSLSVTPVTVATGVLTAETSPDGRFSLLQTQFDNATLRGDARVVHNDGTGNCALAPSTTADSYGDSFLPGASRVFWADNIDPTTGAAEGWLADPDGCNAKQKFADKIDFWFVAGSLGLVYSDNVGATTSTLRYAKLDPGGAWPAAGAVTVQAGVGRIYGLLEPDRQYVVYELNTGAPATDGLWIYGPIGFQPR